MKKTVYWIEGDGIGPEIWSAARPVIDAALAKESDLRLDWVELLAGEKAQKETGSPLPEETVQTLRGAEVAMKGPLGTPVGTGMRSLNVALRHTLDLYACIRPVRHFEGLQTPVKHPEKVDMVIFRENTEDVYAGIEYQANTPEARKLIAFLRDGLGGTKIGDTAAVGIKPMTEQGSKRLVRRALRFALDTGRSSLTLVHKGNIMKFTEGAFRQWGYDLAAEEFGDLTCTEKEPAPGKLVIKDRIADAMFQEALLRPEQYSVIATPNLNGDYLSDALAAQVGGLGLASTCRIRWPSMKPPTARLPPLPGRTRPIPAASSSAARSCWNISACPRPRNAFAMRSPKPSGAAPSPLTSPRRWKAPKSLAAAPSAILSAKTSSSKTQGERPALPPFPCTARYTRLPSSPLCRP